jgi:biopolymer transport protein ExbD
MRYQKRKIPQLNSSSTADIAFLLLIFFLITGSFDSLTGIYRKMSPEHAEEVLKKKRTIEERNYLSLAVDSDKRILYLDDVISFPELKTISKTFIENPNELDYLPQKESIDIPEIGIYPASSKHVIYLEIDREVSFQTYISVLNEILAAYNDLYNEAAQSIFHNSYEQLSTEKQEAIRKIYPIHIYEKDLSENKEGGLQ